MTTFAQRLKQACSDHPDIPDYGKGLQTELAKRMKVSQEAVRKWLAGDSQPRQPTIIRLAKLLDVEYVWLALGTSETEFARLKSVSSRHDAAVYALISFLITKGYNVAIPPDETDRADIHAIGHGVQRNLVVEEVKTSGKRAVTVTAPMPDQTISLIAAIPVHETNMLKYNEHLKFSLVYKFLWVTSDMLKNHGQRSGANWTLELKYSIKKASWMVGGKEIGLFLSRYE